MIRISDPLDPNEPACSIQQGGQFRVIGTREVKCPSGYSWNSTTNPYTYCYRDEIVPPLCDRCFALPQGNPIDPLNGAKLQTEVDYLAGGASYLSLRRHYHGFGHPRRNEESEADFGDSWRTDFHRRVTTQQFGSVQLAYVDRPNGSVLVFKWTGDRWSRYPAGPEQLSQIEAGGVSWYFRNGANELEVFDSLGRLTRIARPDGSAVSVFYTPAGHLGEVRDTFGKAIRFTYRSDEFGDFIESATLPGGTSIQYMTDHMSLSRAPGRLAGVVYPDGSTKGYLYGETINSIAAPRTSLTGIVDELGNRFATFGYSYNGAATTTEHAGGVEKHEVSLIPTFDNSRVTKPNGATIRFNTALVNGVRVEAGVVQPAGSGHAEATASAKYSSTGFVESRDSFTGKRTCYAYVLSRNLETSRVEGLSSSASCGTYTAEGASLPAGSRKVSTAWHPDWRLASKVAEPARLTTKVYNGQPDPFAGGLVASCAPADALLPDGKPIVVLCKQVEQATTDTNGSEGFSAALQSGTEARITSWTYNRWGQVLSEDGPRTDIADVTSYSYYADTTADHTMGDLQSVTNAAGQVSTYTKYNKHGQVLEEVDANGVTTVRTYDLRQRLASVTVAGQTTTYSYDPAGQLTRVTAPDASHVAYEYDPAHRLVAVADSEGNRIEYTLDNAGNKTAEQVKDPNGALNRQLSRVFDALGRMQQTTGTE